MIPSKWGAEAQEEQKGMIQRRMAKLRAEMQHRSDAQRAWGFKIGEASKINSKRKREDLDRGTGYRWEEGKGQGMGCGNGTTWLGATAGAEGRDGEHHVYRQSTKRCRLRVQTTEKRE